MKVNTILNKILNICKPYVKNFPQNGSETLYQNTNIENIEALILKIEYHSSLYKNFDIEYIEPQTQIKHRSPKFHIKPAVLVLLSLYKKATV